MKEVAPPPNPPSEPQTEEGMVGFPLRRTEVAPGSSSTCPAGFVHGQAFPVVYPAPSQVEVRATGGGRPLSWPPGLSNKFHCNFLLPEIETRRTIFTNVSTFLAGISFASILLLLQFRDAIDSTTIVYSSCSLAFSTIFLTYNALSYALPPPSTRKEYTFYLWGLTFFGGYASFFVSLYLLLALISQVVAAASVLLAVGLFAAFIGLIIAGRQGRQQLPSQST